MLCRRKSNVTLVELNTTRLGCTEKGSNHYYVKKNEKRERENIKKNLTKKNMVFIGFFKVQGT